MPILNVLLSGAPSPERSATVATALAGLTADILHKDPALTSIAIAHVGPEHWIVAGTPLAAQGKTSFFLDLRITDGTNARDEKARYIAAVFRRMGELLGNLHPESYVHVNEVRADAYGYGGLTQEHRRLAAATAAG